MIFRHVFSPVLFLALILRFSARPSDAFLMAPKLATVRLERGPQSRAKEVDAKTDNDWKPVDVYQDLDRLEQAIAFSNAEQDLEHKERLALLDHFAQQRRPLYQDTNNFVWRPMKVALLLTLFHKSRSYTRLLAQSIAFAADIHFWALVVTFPILFLSVYPKKSIKTDVPPELQGLDPEYYRFMTTTDWEDPRTSCRDYVQCLLEQWTSAVAGLALASLLPFRQRIAAQFMTRIGVLASLHQYPKLWYQLTRQEQPRPLSGSVWALQTATTRWLLTPWAAAIDLARLLSLQKWTTIGFFYGTAAALLLAVRLSPAPQSTNGQRLRRIPIAKLLGATAFAFWGYQYRKPIHRAWTVVGAMTNDEFLSLMRVDWKAVVSTLALGTALMGTLCHLVAFRKLVCVMYTHNLPLSADPDLFKESVDNQAEQGQNQWRYRLAWRKPRRIRETLNDWRRGFWYWLFFSGSVEEKLRREYHTKRKSEVKRRGLTVLQRIAEEKKWTPDAPRPDRTLWKKRAMDRLAKQHQEDYEKGKFEDPLGLAVCQTFGIGLGFNFDHMSKLGSDELPSTRRLQARAAKSAIRRAQAIYDPAVASEILNKIEDPMERDEKAKELRRQADEEMQYLANRLSELIPTDLSLDDRKNTKVQQFSPKEYVRTSNHQYVLRSPRDGSQTIQSLLDSRKREPENYEIDYLNPSGATEDEMSVGKDDEFIDEWLKQSEGKVSSDDEENEIKTMLV